MFFLSHVAAWSERRPPYVGVWVHVEENLETYYLSHFDPKPYPELKMYPDPCEISIQFDPEFFWSSP